MENNGKSLAKGASRKMVDNSAQSVETVKLKPSLLVKGNLYSVTSAGGNVHCLCGDLSAYDLSDTIIINGDLNCQDFYSNGLTLVTGASSSLDSGSLYCSGSMDYPGNMDCSGAVRFGSVEKIVEKRITVEKEVPCTCWVCRLIKWIGGK